MRAKVPGLGSNTKVLADGSIRYYVRAWRGRGAPIVAVGDGLSLEQARSAAERELGTDEAAARLKLARQGEPARPTSKDFIAGLVDAYLKALKKSEASPNHKATYTRHLTSFKEAHGSWRVSLFERPEIIRDIMEWRSEMEDTPRTADYAISAVSQMFKWARQQGYTKARPTDDIPPLHKSKRADIVWLDSHFEIARQHASPALYRLIRLAGTTALRKGDLMRATWDMVGKQSIALRTSKRSKLAVVPLLPEAKAALEDMPRHGKTIATNGDGEPWTAEAINSAMRRMKERAAAAGAGEDFLRLHFHDLRGTACIKFRRGGRLKVSRLALIMGWSEKRVETLLAIYTGGDDIAAEMLAELEGDQIATE